MSTKIHHCAKTIQMHLCCNDRVDARCFVLLRQCCIANHDSSGGVRAEPVARAGSADGLQTRCCRRGGAGGGAGGERSQADFFRLLATAPTRDQGLELHLFGYCWLHDLQGGDATGLIDGTGVEKQAYAVWKELSSGS